jgi:hypothetical protein
MLRDVATLMLQTGAWPEDVYRIEPKNVHLAENYWFNPHTEDNSGETAYQTHSDGQGHTCRAHGGLWGISISLRNGCDAPCAQGQQCS